jgi:hypothetical protein
MHWTAICLLAAWLHDWSTFSLVNLGVNFFTTGVLSNYDPYDNVTDRNFQRVLSGIGMLTTLLALGLIIRSCVS